MIYISKGMVCKGSTEEHLEVIHHGHSFQLTGMLAYAWLNGQYGFATSKSFQEENALRQLICMGLIECEETDTSVSKYRILSRCILCPVKRKSLIVNSLEKELLTWITKAGIRLSTAELVFLFEHQVHPEENLLYADNRQALVERIYTVDTIADNILETQMERAMDRDDVVKTILQLLRKKLLVIL